MGIKPQCFSLAKRRKKRLKARFLKTSAETCCQSEARVRMTKNPRVGSANGVAVSMATTPGTRMFHVASPQLLIL